MAKSFIVCVCGGREFKVGDPPPEGYLEWHEWAMIQGEAGLKQRQCGMCGLWCFPQELSRRLIRSTAIEDKTWKKVRTSSSICLKCCAGKDKP